MKVITLTTDMGLKDHYVASIKGAILSHAYDARIIDITHEIEAFNISQAAFQLNACYKNFPDGTVHIIGVDSEPIINFGTNNGSFPSILEFEKQYFICTDNGFFGAFLKENRPDNFWRINGIEKLARFYNSTTKNILCPIGIRILNGENIETFATKKEHYNNALIPAAILDTNLIKGHVLHIDNYGNLITNVHRSFFERFGEEVPFTIYLKRKEYYIDEISGAYSDKSQGETVAIFNENDYLEIAINRAASSKTGGADKLLGLSVGDILRIEFTPQGSHKTINSLFE